MPVRKECWPCCVFLSSDTVMLMSAVSQHLLQTKTVEGLSACINTHSTQNNKKHRNFSDSYIAIGKLTTHVA